VADELPAAPSRSIAAGGLGRSALWNLSASLVSVAAAFVVTGAAFRNVPDAILGVFLTAMAAQAVIAMLDPVAGYAVARAVAVRGRSTVDAERSTAVVKTTLAGLGLVALVLAGLGVAGIAAWATVVGPDGSLVAGLLLLLGTVVVQISTTPLSATATGLGDFRASSLATILGAVVGVSCAVATVSDWGVGGLGAGQLLGLISNRTLLLRWRRRHAPWLPVVPRMMSLAAVTALWRDSRSLLLLTVSAQLITWSDLVVVGAFRSASTAAQYRLGVVVPTQAVALLFRAYDVVFPMLARGTAVQQVLVTALLTRVFGAVAGVGLGALIALHNDVLGVLAGRAATGVAVPVYVLFCVMWAANVPVHGLALLLIARDRQATFAPLVAAEAALNIVLTLVLTPPYGATGAAVASLVTLAGCNLVALPLLTRREVVGMSRLVVVEGLIPVVTWLTLTAVALFALGEVLDGQRVRLAAGIAVAGAIAALAVVVTGGPQGRIALRSSLGAR
jgi:O-antigen/teichoic acid export membrane protein